MKRLKRSYENRMVAGVLGGVAEYMNVDPTVVRLVFILLLFFTAIFPMVLAYIVAMFVMPLDA